MSTLVDLVRRTERLRDQMDALRHELDELRQDLVRLEREPEGTKGLAPTAKVDSLAVALALAQDLGPDFSSETAHNLAERGDN